jgi:hypothetical protein
VLRKIWTALSQLWTTPPRDPERYFGTDETAARAVDARRFREPKGKLTA